MWNGTMFVDLDWPLNASSLLSASAELLVIFTADYGKTCRGGGILCRQAHSLLYLVYDKAMIREATDNIKAGISVGAFYN